VAGFCWQSGAMSIHLRTASAADIPAITKIYGHAVVTGTASFETEPPDEAEMARRMAALADRGFPYLVAERDGVLLGYAYAGPYRSRPAYRYSVENSIYVAASGHRRGVGQALLKGLIARCEYLGFRLMVAVIGDSANDASIRLHAACGFEPAGILRNVGWKHGKWLDSVFMTRAIGPGAATPPA
jgi:L-amino acid N-acyltransferase YncA